MCRGVSFCCLPCSDLLEARSPIEFFFAVAAPLLLSYRGLHPVLPGLFNRSAMHLPPSIACSHVARAALLLLVRFPAGAVHLLRRRPTTRTCLIPRYWRSPLPPPLPPLSPRMRVVVLRPTSHVLCVEPQDIDAGRTSSAYMRAVTMPGAFCPARSDRTDPPSPPVAVPPPFKVPFGVCVVFLLLLLHPLRL
jgi:hypothetical protein